MSPKKRSNNFANVSSKTSSPIKEVPIDDSNLFSSFALVPCNSNLLKHASAEKYDLAAECWASYISKRRYIQFPGHHIVNELHDKSLIHEADLIAQHKIRISGSRRIDFGSEINFISFLKEHRLESLHSLAFLSNLTAAYRLTKATKYAVSLQSILSQWFAQYPKVQPAPEAHPVWNESGCGIRIIVILDAYNEMKSERLFLPDFHKMILNIVLSSARWLYRSQEEYRTGSSAFDACAALILAGLYFPELREAGEWLDRGFKRIVEKTSKEFNNEGAFCEMSDDCGVKVLDRLVFVHELLSRKKLAARLLKSFKDSLASFAGYFAITCTPSATTNSFNDSAFILLATRLQEWARIFNNRDFLYPIRHMLPESLRNKIKSPKYPVSLNLPSSGRCIMRSDRDKNALYMAVEYSPADSHSHCETTNFAIFAFGKPMVIDRGRGASPDDPYEFFLRTSRLHSMVVLADENIDINAKYARVNSWHSTEYFDMLALEHDGYKKKFEAVVQRTILFVKPHYWIVSDAVIKPKRTVKATCYLHTLPVLFIEEDGAINCRQAPGIAIAYPRADKLEFIKERAVANLAEFEHEMLWTDYIGFRKSAKVGKGTTFMTVLHPYEMVPPKIKVTRLEVFPEKGKKPVEPLVAEAFEISSATGKDVFFICHGKPLKYRFGNILTDARGGVLRLTASGEPLSLFFSDAGYFELKGKSLHKSKKPATVEKGFPRAKK